MRRTVTFTMVVAMVVAVAPMFPGAAVVDAQTDATGAGRLAWCELLTHDAAAAAQFYAGLFGWQLERHSAGKYRLLAEGALMGGITEIGYVTPELDEATWLIGVTVDDVEVSVAAARARGGEILADVTRAAGGATWAVVEDLQGAQLLVFSGGDHIDHTPGPNRWMWAELWTTDEAAAAAFYGDVVGWTMEEIDHPDGAYPAFHRDGEARAGIVPISGDQVDPGWAPYVGVADLAATLKKARALGGNVLLEPSPEIYGGRVAVVADPTGVGFLVYELDEVTE